MLIRSPKPTLTEANRLPIQHPDYRYPRSRNPYWEKLKATADTVFSDNDSETRRGRWKQGRELHVEVGCNAAHVTAEWAVQHPENTYVGLDWKFKAIFRGFEKGKKKGVKNLYLIRAHAERLQYIFAENEIDHLYLFFPDPWAKKSEWKNRFVNEQSLKTIAKLVKPGGGFHIKTDHRGYFDWMEEAVSKNTDLWAVTDRSTDRHADNPDAGSLTFPEVTVFEQLFIREGLPICQLDLRRLP